MADRMDVAGRAEPIDREALLSQKEEMAARGLRVLAFADGETAIEADGGFGRHLLVDLVFLGLAGMQDPVRPEVPQAIRDCHTAGVDVAMVTGDDPRTAAAIASHAGLIFTDSQVVTGEEVLNAEAMGQESLDALTRQGRIYARVAPAQKLAIVLSLARNGHFVAVTGDGVNDAPALKHAHIGVAMGRKGTEVAKESADIVITDDNFASIVSGIREGRVAYANIRKVIFMLMSTGVAELLLFLLAIPFGMPLPLLAVQLLWLNLVTNGIQDIALSGESPEGDELLRAPRKPSEPIFDRVMIRRILQSTLVMGGGGSRYSIYRSSRATAKARPAICCCCCLSCSRTFKPLRAALNANQSFGSAFLPTRFCFSPSRPTRRFILLRCTLPSSMKHCKCHRFRSPSGRSCWLWRLLPSWSWNSTNGGFAAQVAHNEEMDRGSSSCNCKGPITASQRGHWAIRKPLTMLNEPALPAPGYLDRNCGQRKSNSSR
ncbi:magnesium-transporting ATPase (P-type) [Sinorhizobium fredii]